MQHEIDAIAHVNGVVLCGSEDGGDSMEGGALFMCGLFQHADRVFRLGHAVDEPLGQFRPDAVEVMDDAGDLMDEGELVAIETFMPDTEVAEIMKKYDYESVPVVNVPTLVTT